MTLGITSTDDVGGMQSTLSRINEIHAMLAPTPAPSAVVAPPSPTTTGTSAFAQQLATMQAADPSAAGLETLTTLPRGITSQSVVAPTALTQYAPPGALAPVTNYGAAGPTGQLIANIAQAEVGVREEPAGSNNGARIAEYRTATAGSGVGPWCSYFVSWVTAQAGVPIGPTGQGEGWVPNVERWGKDTGRWIAPNAGIPPQAGDIVIFDRNGDGLTDHIGIVTGARPDGGIDTVEGNSSDAVSRRSYGAGQWSGIVRVTPAGQ